jgi:hypothetical protein
MGHCRMPRQPHGQRPSHRRARISLDGDVFVDHATGEIEGDSRRAAGGSITVPPVAGIASIAAWIAAVSSVRPSPAAPNCRTSSISVVAGVLPIGVVAPAGNVAGAGATVVTGTADATGVANRGVAVSVGTVGVVVMAALGGVGGSSVAVVPGVCDVGVERPRAARSAAAIVAATPTNPSRRAYARDWRAELIMSRSHRSRLAPGWWRMCCWTALCPRIAQDEHAHCLHPPLTIGQLYR